MEEEVKEKKPKKKKRGPKPKEKRGRKPRHWLRKTRDPSDDLKEERARNKRAMMEKIMDRYFFWMEQEDWTMKPCTLKEALSYTRVSKQMFYYNISTDIYIRERYEALRNLKRTHSKSLAEDNLWQALAWEGRFADMERKEVAKLSLDFLKVTDDSYNPKIVTENTNKDIDLTIPMEELMRQFEKYKNM